MLKFLQEHSEAGFEYTSVESPNDANDMLDQMREMKEERWTPWGYVEGDILYWRTRGSRVMDLFVDCDDTLLRYHNTQEHNPYGLWHGLAYTPNFTLMGAIAFFRITHPDSKITIWSAGGAEYAEECAKHLNIAQYCDRFLTKDVTNFHFIKDGDVIVDDDDIDGIRTHTPDEDWSQALGIDF